MGRSETNSKKVYMLDFGLARQYVISNTNEVRPPRVAAGMLFEIVSVLASYYSIFSFSFKGFRGTVRYA